MPTTWLRDREAFIATMTLEGMALEDIRRVLRAAQKWAQKGAVYTDEGSIVEGFQIQHAMSGGYTHIRKETGTAWYRVPTRAS